MVTNLLAYNKRQNIREYNCGGFALGSKHWYVPQAFRARPDSYEDLDTINELFENSVKDILKDFPRLKRIKHYSDAPENVDVIGFRFAIRFPGDELSYENDDGTYEEEVEELDIDDFHFLLRRNGTWWHKPGSGLIRHYLGDPEEDWPRGYCDYNGEIAWFTYR